MNPPRLSLDAYLKSLPNRCPGCGFHVRTQGCRCNVARITPVPAARPLGKITPDEWATFTAALSASARGGEVRQRHMRPKIRGRIEPHHIGSCYGRAIALGLIREVRRERSNDTVGRNTNKDEPVYAYSPAGSEVAA